MYLKELTVQLVIFYENEITKEDDQSRLLENKIEAPFRTDTLRCIGGNNFPVLNATPQLNIFKRFNAGWYNVMAE